MSAKIVRYNLGAKSVVSVRNPRASITFTNASGTQIFIDSSSKDQWFSDSVAFTDSLNFDLSLALSDSFSFTITLSSKATVIDRLSPIL